MQVKDLTQLASRILEVGFTVDCSSHRLTGPEIQVAPLISQTPQIRDQRSSIAAAQHLDELWRTEAQVVAFSRIRAG